MHLLRLLHTLRHLQMRQVIAQFQHRANIGLGASMRAASAPAPPPAACAWEPRCPFLPPSSVGNTASQIAAGDFTFLNRTEHLGVLPAWAPPDLPKLWVYNLHYFDYLWALDFQPARRLVEHWIQTHALRPHAVGWEPYPTSLRLANWCMFFLHQHRQQTMNEAAFYQNLWASIWRQSEWLSRRLEFHLLGNHLLENLATLMLVGTCFSGDDAAAWKRRVFPLLEREIAEQVLSDGGHFERSPMYQCRVVHVLANLLNSAPDEHATWCAVPLRRSIDSLRQLTHPDGSIALLNDAAMRIYPTPEALHRYVRSIDPSVSGEPPQGVFSLRDTGYFGQRSPAGDYICCDAAPIGPDYLPGHAHGDIFSFELSLSGRRIIVDSGVYEYAPGDMRRYGRSTAAHNTVEINGADQVELWGAFRVARRGRPHDVRFAAVEGGFRLSAWHDGYRRLRGSPTHHRTFRWHPDGVLMVRDEVRSARPVQLASRLHLHPDCDVEQVSEHNVTFSRNGEHYVVSFAGGGRVTCDEYPYSPEFGIRIQAPVLVHWPQNHARFGFCILRGSAPIQYDPDQPLRAGDRSYGW
jgi:uncharacterized heparinase superfamily protein